MQYSEFERQIERLRKVYSSTSLNEERVKLMWDRFKLVDAPQFECAVNHIIGENTTQALPALSRFAEAIAMFSPSRSLSPTQNAEVASNPNSARLAKEYGDKILRVLRGGIGQELPYDPNERIDKEQW